MKRKVVKQGSSTLMVSLPSAWAHKFKVKKGDELEVEERDRVLMVSMRKEFVDKEGTFNIDDLYPMTMVCASALYKSGYDKLNVTFNDPKRIADVNNVVRDEFSGFEIIEQSKSFCVVKKIEESLQEGFDPVLRRTFLLLLNMADDSLVAIKNSDDAELERLMLLERANNRLTTYCTRYLSKRGYGKPGNVHFIYYIISMLEMIADEYWYLFSHISKKKNYKISKDVLDYYIETNKMFRLYYELFYKFEKPKLVKIGEIYYDLLAKTDKLMESHPKEAVIVHYLSNIKEYTFSMTSPYLSMVM